MFERESEPGRREWGQSVRQSVVRGMEGGSDYEKRMSMGEK